jgi:hypothetical protein
LSFHGERTEDLPYNVEASAMKEALESLSTIHYVTIDREGPFDYGTYEWTVRFDAWEDDSPYALERLYAEGHLLNGVGASITTTTDYCPSTTGNLTSSLVVTTQAGRVGDTFYVALEGEETVHANVSYIHNGLYEVVYKTPSVGDYTMQVARAVSGGLHGSYFNNRWLHGDAIEERVDSMLNFYWSEEDTITETGKDYISIRWVGYILPSFTETFTFYGEVNDGLRLWVNGELLIDAFDAFDGASGLFRTVSGTTSKPLIEGQLVDIKIEFVEYVACLDEIVLVEYFSTKDVDSFISTFPYVGRHCFQSFRCNTYIY